VRSALLSIKGVQRADVMFEGHEARVEYDPTQCTVNDLLRAVANAKDPTMPVQFGATVKK
jgi:copper chaperone CopZ